MGEGGELGKPAHEGNRKETAESIREWNDGEKWDKIRSENVTFNAPPKRITGRQHVTDEKQLLARNFRKNPTVSEKMVWELLRNRTFHGYKFRRQQVIEGFVVDFCCPELKLIIEIDGPVHDQQQPYDIARQTHLETLGLRVVRFRNEHISQEGFLSILEDMIKNISHNDENHSTIPVDDIPSRSSTNLSSNDPSILASPSPFMEKGTGGDEVNLSPIIENPQSSNETHSPASPSPFMEKGTGGDEVNLSPFMEKGTGGDKVKLVEYSEAISVYLGLAVNKIADRDSTICSWDNTRDSIRNTFGRQAVPMVWDFAESNVFSNSSGSISNAVDQTLRTILTMPCLGKSKTKQIEAQIQTISRDKIVSTDPPYYDNIGYADLSDFFYIWLRRSLKNIYPDLFATVAVPKTDELVATPYRHGSKVKAEAFFLEGMTQAMNQLAKQTHPAFPVTIYYAFKQSETENAQGTTNTGWETFLDAVIRAGFSLTGTWPMRTELSNRMIGSGTNALASSIVLVCRKRSPEAPIASRREFLTALKSELPIALRHLQQSNIAPVDLAQSAIGPGMAIFTRYSKVLDTEGNPITVREALALINLTLDEVLAEQEGDFDPDTRWALAWFDQHGFDDGEYGVAETLSKAKNTSVSGMVHAGILVSKAGKVRILRPSELPKDWDPDTDTRFTVWEMVHHLIRVFETGGDTPTAELVARLGSKADAAREIAYRLYTICERKKRAAEALSYNALVQNWPEILNLVQIRGPIQRQADLFRLE